MTDTIIEKKLKQDIHEKNLIRSEIEILLGDVSRWKDKLINLKSFKGQRKYTDSIKRYISEIEKLRAGLNKMNEYVDKHIREVGKFSDSEVKEFTSQLEKKISEIESGNESGVIDHIFFRANYTIIKVKRGGIINSAFNAPEAEINMNRYKKEWFKYGKPFSDHRPIWAEFSFRPDDSEK